MEAPEVIKKTLLIGVGVSTYRRPKTFKLWMKQFCKHTQNLPEGVEIAYHVQTFYPNKHSGVAAVKNACLRELMSQGCEFIFLFDDDCFPIHDDWWMPFIEAHLRTGQAGNPQHHFLWLKDDSAHYSPTVGRTLLREENGITVFSNAQGCCIFLTRPAVEAVGAFDEKFGLYGSEHENYSMRVRHYGLNTMGPHLSVPGIENYIWSLDVCGVGPFASQLGNEVDKATGRLRSAGDHRALAASAQRNIPLLKEKTQLHIPL